MTFGYMGSFLVMTLLVVGVAVPTPGQVGGFHTAYKIAVMTFFGASETTAIGAAIVLHAISFVPVTLLGLFFMAREGLTFGTVRHMADMKSQDADGAQGSQGSPGAPGAAVPAPAPVRKGAR